MLALIIMTVLMLAALVITAATQTWWMWWAWDHDLQAPVIFAGLMGVTAVGALVIIAIGALTT
jgi:hypothetical protein